MKPTKQTVYLPIKIKDELPQESGFYKTEEEGTSFFQRGDQTWWDNDVHSKKRFPENWLKPKEGYFFTPEQLNQFISDVIKDALDTAAEKANITYTEEKTWDFTEVDKISITNTLQETFNKFNV